MKTLFYLLRFPFAVMGFVVIVLLAWGLNMAERFKGIQTLYVLLLLSVAARATTLTVPGQFTTVQEAVNAAKTGDTISLTGVFPEEVTTKASQPGVALEGGELHRLVLVKPNWKVKNVSIKGWKQTRTWLALVELTPGAHGTVLEKLKIDGTGTNTTDGLRWGSDGAGTGSFPPSMASDCRVTDCEVSNITGYTCLMLDGARNVVSGCYFHDVIQSDFVRLFGENNLITRCRFERNKFAPEGTVGFHSDFIQTFGYAHGSRNNIIEWCEVRDLEGQITQLEQNGFADITGWIFRNNLFVNTTLGASITHTNLTWDHNTFVRCNTTGGHVLNFGNGPRGSSNGMKIYGNVFLDCGKPGNVEMGWYGDGTTEKAAYGPVEYSADFNYYAKGVDFKPARIDSVSPVFRWNELHGVNGGDPKMTADFHLLAGSPLIGKGPGGTDIGAFPFSSVPPPVDPPPAVNWFTVEVSKDGGETWETLLQIRNDGRKYRLK